MPKLFSRLSWVTLAMLFCFGSPVLSFAQSDDPCKNDAAQEAWESGSDPVFNDASELARTLAAHGFLVECIRSSKEQAMVKGQKGGAWFKTNQGIFDVWFLPKGQNFDAPEITGRQQPNGRYIYPSEGAQGAQGSLRVTMDSSKQNWFITYQNVEFHVFGDKQLADSLEKAFQKP